MACGLPTGLTLMPTTSPGSNRLRHASTGSSMPGRDARPRPTMRRATSGVGTPARAEARSWASATPPGQGPGRARALAAGRGDDGVPQAEPRTEHGEDEHDPRAGDAAEVEAEARARRPQTGGEQLGEVDGVAGVHPDDEEAHHGQEPEGLRIGLGPEEGD